MAAKRKKPESYIRRDYRGVLETGDLVSCLVRIKDTDLHILADKDVGQLAQELALQYRLQIETYITKNPAFGVSFSPLAPDSHAPPVVKEMLDAAMRANVGPMAAVAGVIAEYVGKGLVENGCSQVMVENGGDVFIHRTEDCRAAIFAGESPLSNKIGVTLRSQDMPLGVCTSSGTVGHSISFGKADSVTVIAKSTALADTVATWLGNEIGTYGEKDVGIKKVLETGKKIEGVMGIVIICNELIGAVGDVELKKIA